MVSDSSHGCEKMRLVQDYVKWMLTSPSARVRANEAFFQAMPKDIAQEMVAVVDGMVCDGQNLSNVEPAMKALGCGSSLQGNMQVQTIFPHPVLSLARCSRRERIMRANANADAKGQTDDPPPQICVQKLLADEYFFETSKTIFYNAIGSGSGLKEFGKSNCEFAGSDSIISEDKPGVVSFAKTRLGIACIARPFAQGDTFLGTILYPRLVVNGGLLLTSCLCRPPRRMSAR